MQIHDHFHAQFPRPEQHVVELRQRLVQPAVVGGEIVGRGFARDVEQLPAHEVAAPFLREHAQILALHFRMRHRAAQRGQRVALENRPIRRSRGRLASFAGQCHAHIVEPRRARDQFQAQMQGELGRVFRHEDAGGKGFPVEGSTGQAELRPLRAGGRVHFQHHLDAVPILRLGGEALGAHVGRQVNPFSAQRPDRHVEGAQGRALRVALLDAQRGAVAQINQGTAPVAPMQIGGALQGVAPQNRGGFRLRLRVRDGANQADEEGPQAWREKGRHRRGRGRRTDIPVRLHSHASPP
jgi:hypothetical protein